MCLCVFCILWNDRAANIRRRDTRYDQGPRIEGVLHHRETRARRQREEELERLVLGALAAGGEHQHGQRLDVASNDGLGARAETRQS